MEIHWLALTIERRVLLQETRGVKNGVCGTLRELYTVFGVSFPTITLFFSHPEVIKMMIFTDLLQLNLLSSF